MQPTSETKRPPSSARFRIRHASPDDNAAKGSRHPRGTKPRRSVRDPTGDFFTLRLLRNIVPSQHDALVRCKPRRVCQRYLFPLGVLQLHETVTHGYYEARALDFITSDAVRTALGSSGWLPIPVLLAIAGVGLLVLARGA